MDLFASYDSPLGMIQIGHKDGQIVSIRRSNAVVPHSPSPVSELASLQLQEYFSGIRRAFDLPIAPRGTAFQIAVWNALCCIPYGEGALTVKSPQQSENRKQAALWAWLATVIPCGS